MKKEKLKVVLATPYNGRTGGISRWAHHIQDYYRTNHKDELCLSFMPIDRENEELSHGQIKRIFSGIKTYMVYLKREISFLRNTHPHVFHLVSSASFGLIKDMCMLFVANKFSCKTMLHFRFGRIPELRTKRNWEWRLLCRVINKSSVTIVLDERSRVALIEEGLNNVIKIPNPISSKVFEYVNSKEYKREENCVLFVGHCYREKGVFELADACATIPNIRLVYAGTISEDIKNEIIKKIDNKIDVLFTGNLNYEDVLDYMMRCSVLVLPSYTEGFPNVILEAMACACPIVATNVGAIPEMLDDNANLKSGITIPVKDSKILHGAISKILDDKDFAQELGLRAKKRVVDCYSMESIWNELSKAWNSLL